MAISGSFTPSLPRPGATGKTAPPCLPPFVGVLRLTRAQDVEDLVTDIRAAARRSRRTGGCYSVCRLNDQRQCLLSLEIHLSTTEPVPSRPTTRRPAP